MSDNELRHEYKHKILKIIAQESRYRPTVLFLGSGISVSSGFPVISEVIHYLAKVKFAIEFGVYENRIQLPCDEEKQKTVKNKYRQHPSKFLENFGWPQIRQLDADLWAWLDTTKDENGYEKIAKNEKDEIEIFKIKEENKNKLNKRITNKIIEIEKL